MHDPDSNSSAQWQQVYAGLLKLSQNDYRGRIVDDRNYQGLFVSNSVQLNVEGALTWLPQIELVT